jgi:hypothetical protein
MMTPSGYHEQPIELVQKLFRTAPLVGQMLALRSPDTTLDAVLVEATEDLLEGRRQIEGMTPERLTLHQATFRGHLPKKWS